MLLTLEFFSDYKLSTIRTTPVLSFRAEAPNKRALEADFGLLWEDSIYGEKREGLIFGKCKTYGSFERKDFDRMRYLAQAFPGSVLVFSTLRKSLNTKEIDAISRIAKAGRKYWKNERPINPVLILTGTELLSRHGPPYCWEEPRKSQLDFRGLLGLCNATQQLYLNLPPWETAWQSKWERRLQRRQAKLAAMPQAEEG